MENHDRPSGKIESTETLWDMTDIERIYITKGGNRIDPKDYTGDGEIIYERSGFESNTPLREEVRPLSGDEIERENHLIFILSGLYGKRDNKYLSKVLESVENDEYYFCPNIEQYGYLDYLKDHNSPKYDADFYRFAQWYDYALKKYAREKFLPKARQYETEYAKKVRSNIALGLFPESTATKLAPFDTHSIKYSIIDAFNEQDIGGKCIKHNKNDLTIKYRIEYGLGDEKVLPLEYQSRTSDFQQVMTHESTHMLFTSLFGVYDNDSTENWDTKYKKREALEQALSKSQLETIEKADEIITEGAVEWITQILNEATSTSKANTPGGAYHTERLVIDSLLNDGLERIEAGVLFSLCAMAGDELEANREKLFDALFQSYPDCQTKLDIAEKIVERFNWFEYQSREDNHL